MSTSRVPAGIPSGGQFAATVQAEASISLAVSNETVETKSPAEVERERIAGALETVGRMVARETSRGMTTVERQEDVEFDLRQEFGHIEPERFDSAMSTIGRLAEQISTTEAAEDTDTEAYEDAALEVGKTLDDFPAEDPGYDDAYYDCAAFRSGVIDELDQSMYACVRDLVRADEAARLAATSGSRSTTGLASA